MAGVILEFAIHDFPGIAIYQPVVNGVGGNIVSYFLIIIMFYSKEAKYLCDFNFLKFLSRWLFMHLDYRPLYIKHPSWVNGLIGRLVNGTYTRKKPSFQNKVLNFCFNNKLIQTIFNTKFSIL